MSNPILTQLLIETVKHLQKQGKTQAQVLEYIEREDIARALTFQSQFKVV